MRQGARSARAREIEHRVAQLGDENGSSAQENGSSARRGTGSNASGAWSLPPRASPAAALAASSPSLAASTPSLAASSASLKDRSALRGTSSALRLTRPPLLAAPLPRGSTQRSAALVPPNLRGSASPEASPPAPAMPVRTLSTRGAPAHPRASPSLAPQPLASATSLRLRGFRAPAPPYPPRTASAGAAVLAGPADRPNGGAPPRLGAERGGSGSKGGGGPETRDTSRAPPAPDPHLGRAAFRARSAERRAAATGAAAAAVGGIGHAPAGSAGGCPPPPPPLFRTNRTRRVPHPVLIGHAASLSQVVKTRAMTAPSAVATRCSARCLQSGRSSWREHGPASGRQGSRATATRPRKGSPRAPRTAGARSLGRARHRGPRGFSRMGVNQSRETSDELNDIKGRRVK